MARKTDGWVRIHSKILKEDLTPSQFKFFVGAIVLANPPVSKDSGLVDLSFRQLSKELNMSRTEVWRREQELAQRGMISLRKRGFVINKYYYYQTGKSVPPTEQNINTECPAEGTKSPAHETVKQESVPPKGLNVPFLEPERPPKKEEDIYKKYKKNHAIKKPHDFLHEKRQKVFEGLKERRSYNSSVPGAEAAAITWMLKQGYSMEQILACHDKMKQDKFWGSRFLSMQSVKNQIGEFSKGKLGKKEGYPSLPTTEELKKSLGGQNG